MHFFYQKGRNGQLRRAWHYASRLYHGGARWYRALVLPQDIATIKIPAGPQAVVVPLGETAVTVVETRVDSSPLMLFILISSTSARRAKGAIADARA